MQIILGSSSPYRKTLLEKFKINFLTATPDIDETPEPFESAYDLVARLALAKAREVAKYHTNALIISSDQVATIDDKILGKSGNYENAFEQLKNSSGKAVTFYTALCLLNGNTCNYQLETIPFTVHFRELSDAEIKGYIEKEQPFNCAGSFQAEGLGVTLFEKMQGDDPNTIVGLPLMRLNKMLQNEGVNVLL